MTLPFRAEDVTVVIPTRDNWGVLSRSLDALRSQTTPGFHVVVVVDGEDQQVPALAADITVLNKPHAGPGAARNLGIQRAGTALVLLLGDDMFAAPDLIERHVDAHNERPEPQAAVLGHVDWHPETRQGRVQRWLDWSGTQFEFDRIEGEDAGAGRFYSSNVSAKRALLLDVGGFDEDFPFVYEDIDLGLRLADKGMHLRYRPDAKTLHCHRYDQRSLQRRFRIIGTGEQIFCAKHPELSPYFLDRIRARRRVPSWSPWPRLVDAIPTDGGRLRQRAETQADAWYLKTVTEAYLTGWTAGAELTELRRYLSSDFDYPRLMGRAGTPTPPDDKTALYERTREVMDGRFTTWVDELLRLAAPPSRALAYGASTGTVGLHLLDAGLDVTFADVDGSPLRYLQWRLAQRGHATEPVVVSHLDGDVSPLADTGLFALAVAPDLAVSSDPGAVLSALGATSEIVAVGLSPAAPSSLTRMVMAHITANGAVVRNRVHPDRGRLVVYRTGRARARPWDRARTSFGGRQRRSPWPPVARS